MAGEYSLSIIMSATDSASSAIEGMIGHLDPLTGFALGAGAAVLGIGVKATEMASTFQSAMNKVQVYTGLTGQQTQQMGNQILALAPQVGQSADEMAAGLYTVATAGFRGKDALTVLRFAGETSASANVDAATTMQALVHSMDALGVGANQSGNIMDELNATVRQGDMQWTQYGAVIGKLAGAVSVAGGGATLMQHNFTDLNASLDVYTNSGVSARQASMYLNADMNLLDGKIGTLSTHAAKLGISFDATKFKSMDFAHQLAYLNKITGGNRQELVALTGGNSTVANSVMFLNNHYGTLKTSIAGITSSMQNGKTTNDMFATTQQTLAFQTAAAQQSFNVFMITLGQHLLPIVTPLVAGFGHFMGVLTNLMNFVAGNQTAMDVFVAILITIALVILDAVVPAIIAATIAALPWIAAFLVVAAVVLGVILVIQHWGQIVQFFSALWHTVWGAVSAFFVNIWNGISSFFVGLWANIVAFFKAHILLIIAIVTGPLGALVILIITHWSQITAFFSGLWARVVGLFQSARSNLVNAVHTLWSDITSFLQTLPAQMLHWGEELIQNLINGILNMAGGVVNAVSNIAGKIAGFLHFTRPELGPLASVEDWMPHFGDVLVNGMMSNVGKLSSAAKAMASPIAGGVSTGLATTGSPTAYGATSVPSGSSTGGQATTTFNINYTGNGKWTRQDAIDLMGIMQHMQRMSGLTPATASGRRY